MNGWNIPLPRWNNKEDLEKEHMEAGVLAAMIQQARLAPNGWNPHPAPSLRRGENRGGEHSGGEGVAER